MNFHLGNGLVIGLSKASFWWKFRILNGMMEANQSYFSMDIFHLGKGSGKIKSRLG